MSEEIVAQTAEVSPAALAAAQWWAEQCGAPVHILTPGGDHPDAEYGAVASSMMDEITRRHPIREGQGDKLVAALSVAIDKRLTDNGAVTLSVDYGPDRVLADAADAAGVHTSRFPMKTVMWARPTHVTASLGYRGRDRLVWMAPDWPRPDCGNHKVEADYYPLPFVCSKPRYHDEDCGEWIPDTVECEDCGGTYVDHYGRDVPHKDHSWKPVQS